MKQDEYWPSVDRTRMEGTSEQQVRMRRAREEEEGGRGGREGGRQSKLAVTDGFLALTTVCRSLGRRGDSVLIRSVILVLRTSLRIQSTSSCYDY